MSGLNSQVGRGAVSPMAACLSYARLLQVHKARPEISWHKRLHSSRTPQNRQEVRLASNPHSILTSHVFRKSKEGSVPAAGPSSCTGKTTRCKRPKVASNTQATTQQQHLGDCQVLTSHKSENESSWSVLAKTMPMIFCSGSDDRTASPASKNASASYLFMSLLLTHRLPPAQIRSIFSIFPQPQFYYKISQPRNSQSRKEATLTPFSLFFYFLFLNSPTPLCQFYFDLQKRLASTFS